MNNSKRRLPFILILIGILTALFALFSDRLGLGGGAGIGAQQALLLLCGAILVLGGVFALSPLGRKVAQAWHASSLEPQVEPDGSTKTTVVEILLIASFMSLVAGFSEVLALSVLRINPQWLPWDLRYTNVSWESLWVTPAVYWVLFSLLAVAVMPAILLLRRIRTFRKISPRVVTVLVFAWLYFFVLLRIPDRLATKAILILALGLAFQIARWYSGHRSFFVTLFRRGTPVLAMFVVVFLLFTRGARQIHETLLTRNLPQPPAQAPNVLVIVVDTLRADHLSAYGYARQTTPNMDAFAREGVLFENAYSSSSWTPPGHASLMTGQPLNVHQVDGNFPLLRDKFFTLAEYMASKGYLTAGFTANTLWINRNTGFDQGFVHFDDYYWSWNDMLSRTVLGHEVTSAILPALGYHDLFGRRRAEDMNRSVLSWLDRNPQKPFFMFVNYFDVHGPYYSPDPYHTGYMKPSERQQAKGFSFDPAVEASDAEKALFMDAYDGSLRYMDSEFGQLIEELNQRGILDNTLVVLTSDHGEAFGEHGLFEHGNSLYREVVHIPMVIRYPGLIPPNQRISTPVSIMDVPATISTALFPDEQPVFPGQSLTALFSGRSQTAQESFGPVLIELMGKKWLPKAWPVGLGWVKSLIDSQYQYIVYESGKAELFRVSGGEPEKDLSSTPEGRAVIDRFSKELGQLLNSNSTPVTSQ